MPTFSEITITFTNDWVDGDILYLVTRTNNDPLVNYQWNWVTTRSSGYEVTTGTPTGNAGETSAINFEAAFDLDLPSNFITTVQNNNEVLIQSETEGLDFLGIRADGDNTGSLSVVFDNYVVTPSPANVSLALTSSPHYINTPFDFDQTTKATINLYVWDGDLTTVPVTATQTLTKIRPTINYAEFNTDISNIVKAEIEATPQYNIASTTQIIDSGTNDVKWVHYLASYTDATNTIADIEGTFVATDGYGYYSEGVNPSNPSSRVLTSCNYRKVSRDSFIMFPFLNDGTITSIDIDSDGGEINATETPAVTNQSAQYIQYVTVDVSQTTNDNYITIDVGASSYTWEIVDECRYTPQIVVFKNKYGVFDTLTMFKKRTTNIQTENESFNNNYISAGVYDTTVHQFKKLNVTATEKVKLNSGFVKESENDLYKEMLLSDKVYFYDGGYIPVNVSTKGLEYKTRLNDGLINYTIDFDYAYNTINNV